MKMSIEAQMIADASKQIKDLEAQIKAKNEEIAMFKKDTTSLGGYNEFMEQLETFDFDSFGKDDCFDNSDVYQILQFFAHKIYGVLGKQIEAKDEEIERLKTQLNSSFVKDVSGWQPIVGSIKNPTPTKKG